MIEPKWYQSLVNVFNLSGLNVNHEDLRKAQKSTSSIPWSVEVLREQKVLRVMGKPIHSARKPLEAALRWIERESKEPWYSLVFLDGFELGYGVKALATMAQRWETLVVVSDSLEELLWGIENGGFYPDQWPENIKIRLRSHYQSHGSLVGFHEIDPALCLRVPNLRTEDFLAPLVQQIEHNGLNYRTLKRFGSRWVHNVLRNRITTQDRYKLASVFGAFEGVPALVCAAGPTLDVLAPHWPDLAKRFVIIAVDTAVRHLNGMGIHPHFAVSVDPQYWNSRHLDGTDAEKSHWVSELSTYPRNLRLMDQLFVFHSPFPVAQHYQGSEPLGSLAAGGSVATSAVDLAYKLGCDRVYIAGLDLAFPRLKSHSSRSLFEERILQGGHRVRPAEQSLWSYVNSETSTVDKNYDGTPLASDQRLLFYRRWFEAYFQSLPRHKTPRIVGWEGARIEGTLPVSVEQLLTISPWVEDPRTTIEARKQTMADVDIDEKDQAFLESLEAMEQRCERLISLAHNAKDNGSAESMEELLRAEAGFLVGGGLQLSTFLAQPAAIDLGRMRFEKTDRLLDHEIQLFVTVRNQCRELVRDLGRTRDQKKYKRS